MIRPDLMHNPFELFGIIGFPVHHTLSPLMHGIALKHHAIEGSYMPFQVEPGSLEAALAGLKALGFRGINVTVPHKEGVIPLMDDLSEEARLIGAVNTILFHQGTTSGHNTDGRGFIRSLEEEGAGGLRGRTVLILGAGGSARAIAVQLLLCGSGRIIISNRTLPRGEALREDLLQKIPGSSVEAIPAREGSIGERLKEADIVINTTTLGMDGREIPPVPVSLLRPEQTVCDIIYRPPITPLLRAAAGAGCKTVNGLGMLLHQGSLSFEIWTGKTFPIEEVRGALMRALGMEAKK